MVAVGISESMSHVRRVVRETVRDPRSRTLLLAFGTLFFVSELYTAAVPLLFDAVGLSAAVYGLARAVANGVEIVASPALGTLADEYGRVQIAVLAALGTAVALLGFGVARTLPVLGVLVALVAVGKLAVNNAVTPALSAIFDDEDAGTGWGLRDITLYGGSALGLTLGSGLAAGDDIRTVFPALAVVSFGLAVVLWRRVGGRGAHTESDADGGDTGGDDGESADSTGTDDIATDSTGTDGTTTVTTDRLRDRLSLDRVLSPVRGLSRPGVFARIAVVDLFVGVGTAALAFLPLLAVALGRSTAEFLALYGGAHLLAAPLSVVGGVLADRYSQKLLYVGNFAVEAAMLAAFAATALGEGSQGATVETGLFLLGLALFVAQTTFEPGVLAYFFDVFPEEEGGQVWGLKGAVSKTAGLVGPAALGWLYTLDPQLPFLVGAVLTAAGTAVAATLPAE